MDAVATHNLSKSYATRTPSPRTGGNGRYALRTLNLRVGPGQLFGFLGPNGAGKTTALRLLLGLLRATAGHAVVLGRDAWHDGPQLRREVGYLPGDVRLYDDLTGRATLAFFNAARRAHADAEIRRLTGVLDLDLRKRVRSYSRGMKQKLALIIALMHRPQLLILDEPTTALDPLVREVLYAELRAAAAEGRTVLFSSHTLAEVEALCDEVAILRAGELVEQERMDVLRARAVRHVDIRLAPGAASLPPWPEGLQVAQHTDRRVQAAWNGPMERLLAWLSRCSVQDLTIAPPDLDDLFLTYYRDRTGDAS